MQPQPTHARNEIGPLLDRLIAQLGEEGCATQRAHFARIRRSLDLAQDELTLSQHIIALGTTNAVGIRLSDEAAPLHLRILEKAAVLAGELSGTPGALH